MIIIINKKYYFRLKNKYVPLTIKIKDKTEWIKINY